MLGPIILQQKDITHNMINNNLQSLLANAKAMQASAQAMGKSIVPIMEDFYKKSSPEDAKKFMEILKSGDIEGKVKSLFETRNEFAAMRKAEDIKSK